MPGIKPGHDGLGASAQHPGQKGLPCPTSLTLESNHPRRYRRRRRRSRARSGARRRARQEGLDLGAAVDARQDVAGRTQDARCGDQPRQGHASRRRSTARRDILKSAALDARLASETIDVTLPLRDAPAEQGRIHPLSQVMDELTAIFADMGFADRRRSGHRDRRLQLHQTEFPRRPSGARDARHLLLQSEGRTARACCCAPTPRRCRCAPC